MFVKTFSNSVFKTLQTLKAELNDLLRRKAEFVLHRTRQNYYFNGARPRKLLALRLKQSQAKACIDIINHPSKGLVRNSKEINSAFSDFFSKLYISELNPSSSSCSTFLQSLTLPRLSHEEAEQLGQPVTLEELKEALQGANKRKAPGLDGIPVELFLKYFDLLGPVFLTAIHAAVEAGAFHPQLNTALISLIPKKGKDHSNCANYRPISLLNTDIKMYARILALRLQRYINKLVHPDQTGFMPGRLAADNIRRLLHVIHESRACPTPAEFSPWM